MKLRAFALVTALLLLLAMTACGKGSVTSDPNSTLPSEDGGIADDNTTNADGTGSDVAEPDASTTAGNLLNTTANQSGSSTTGNKATTTTSKTTAKTQKLESGEIDTPQEKKFLSLRGKTVTVCTETPYDTFNDDTKSFYASMEKKYGVTLDWMVLTGSEQQTKIGQLVAAGDAPDLCNSSYVLFLRYVYGNVIQSMEPYIDKTDPIWKVNSWTLSMYDHGGTLYSLPYAGSCGAYMVYYNKTMFEENNQKTPSEYYKEGKWNFENFLKCAKAMTLYRDDGVTVKTFGCSVPVPMVFCLANGEPGLTVDKNGDMKVSIDSKAGIAGLQLLSDLYAGGYCGDGNFAQRKVSMAIDRPEYLIYNNDLYNTMEDEIGMVPMPTGTTGKQYVPMGMDGYAIPRNCKNPLGGMMVIYESYVKTQNQYYDTIANGATAERVEQRRQILSDEHMKIYKDYVSNATPCFTNLESLAGWWDAGYKSEFWKSIYAGKSPAAAIDSMKSVLNSAIKRTAG